MRRTTRPVESVASMLLVVVSMRARAESGGVACAASHTGAARSTAATNDARGMRTQERRTGIRMDSALRDRRADGVHDVLERVRVRDGALRQSRRPAASAG